MSKEELEKLEREKYVVERKLTAAMHKEKRLQSELKRLTRSERTHRLCTRAGMLETFLKEPTAHVNGRDERASPAVDMGARLRCMAIKGQQQKVLPPLFIKKIQLQWQVFPVQILTIRVAISIIISWNFIRT